MQVPSALFNPLMSWRKLRVYQLPQSFRAWEWGAICQPSLGPGFCTAEFLDARQWEKAGPSVCSSDFQTWCKLECRFPIFDLLVLNLKAWGEDICMFNQLPWKIQTQRSLNKYSWVSLTCSRIDYRAPPAHLFGTRSQVIFVRAAHRPCASVPGLGHLPSNHVLPATECQLCAWDQLTCLVPTGIYLAV